MTAMRGYIPAVIEQGALGVHSLDHFVLAVPDLLPATAATIIFLPLRNRPRPACIIAAGT